MSDEIFDKIYAKRQRKLDALRDQDLIESTDQAIRDHFQLEQLKDEDASNKRQAEIDSITRWLEIDQKVHADIEDRKHARQALKSLRAKYPEFRGTWFWDKDNSRWTPPSKYFIKYMTAENLAPFDSGS